MYQAYNSKMEENNMNEQLIQAIITNLGNTIAQLNIDLAAERAQTKQLVEELEKMNAELNELRAANESTEQVIDNE